MNTRRYVVLRHEGVAEPHFDLMVERDVGGALITARLKDWPPQAPTRIEPLRDHRRAYLDYEGPVSNGRGHVKRIEEGACDVEIADGVVTIRFQSGQAIQFHQRPASETG
jgi:hypothetical protein